MKARKKPVVVEVVKFDGFRSVTGQAIFSDRPEWLNNALGKTVRFFGEVDTVTIVTLGGDMIAAVGDYIIKGVNGEIYPCKPEIFHKTYEVIE